MLNAVFVAVQVQVREDVGGETLSPHLVHFQDWLPAPKNIPQGHILPKRRDTVIFSSDQIIVSQEFV